MRRGTTFVLGAAALACLALTTDAVRAEDEAPDAAADTTTDADPSAVFAKLETEYKEARAAYYASRRAQPIGSTEKPEPKPPAEQVMWPKYRDAAEQFAGQPAAAQFLVRAVQYALRHDEAAAQAALDTLIASHAAGDDWTQLTYTFLYYPDQLGAERVAKAIEAAIGAHDGAGEVTASMLFARGAAVTRRQFDDDKAREAAVEESLVDLRRAVEVAPDSGFGQRAASTIFELTRLQIGMAAPDIEGDDLDGVAFKLSDYRGNVVVLDFWGDW